MLYMPLPHIYYGQKIVEVRQTYRQHNYFLEKIVEEYMERKADAERAHISKMAKLEREYKEDFYKEKCNFDLWLLKFCEDNWLDVGTVKADLKIDFVYSIDNTVEV